MKNSLELENNISLQKRFRFLSWNFITNINSETIAIILIPFGALGLTVS
jgi:hypothetical protein